MSDAKRPIATLAVELAKANCGIVEVGENRGKAVEAYLASCIPPLPPGNPWCVAHVRYRLKQAATQLGLVYDESMPRTGYTPDYYNWAVENDKWVSKTRAENNPKLIRRGDLCLFYFSTLGRHAHMGMVVEYDGEKLIAIEGNTSPPNTGTNVDRDGDGLYLKYRTLKSLGSKGGFVRLDF
jgi:hypothetical protein